MDSHKKYWIATLVLIAFHIIANSVWIFLNQGPPQFDAGFHTVLTMRFTDAIQHHPQWYGPIGFLRISQYYPPLTHWIAMVFVWLGNYNYQVIQLVGTLFFSVALIATYRYVRLVTHSERAAFFSVFFFSFFMTVFEESRIIMTDIPSAAFFMLGLYLLEKSDGLYRRRLSLLFFVCFGLSLLARWTSIVFFAIPILFAIIHGLRTHKSYGRMIFNIFFGAALMALMCLPWYLANITSILQIARISATPEADDPQVILSWENALFYPKVITLFQLHAIGTIFLMYVWGFMAYETYKHRKHLTWHHFEDKSVAPLLSLILSYIIFTFGVGNKNIRYLLPIMPLVAMYMGWGVDIVMTHARRAWVIWGTTFVLFYYVVAYGMLSFGLPVQPEYKFTAKLPLLGYVDLIYLATYPVNGLYARTHWPNEEIGKALLDSRDPHGNKTFFIGIEKPALSSATVQVALYQEAHGLPVGLVESDTDFINRYNGQRRFPSEKAMIDYIKTLDVVILPKKGLGDKIIIRDYDFRLAIQQYFLTGKAIDFQVFRVFPTPDGDEIVVWVRESAAK